MAAILNFDDWIDVYDDNAINFGGFSQDIKSQQKNSQEINLEEAFFEELERELIEKLNETFLNLIYDLHNCFEKNIEAYADWEDTCEEKNMVTEQQQMEEREESYRRIVELSYLMIDSQLVLPILKIDQIFLYVIKAKFGTVKKCLTFYTCLEYSQMTNIKEHEGINWHSKFAEIKSWSQLADIFRGAERVIEMDIYEYRIKLNKCIADYIKMIISGRVVQ